MGELVLSACTDGQGILATDLHTCSVVATLEENAVQPRAFGMLGHGSGHIFAVQRDKALWHVWPLGQKKPAYRASLPEKMTAMVFSNDGSICVAGSPTGSIYVWLMGTGSLLRCWPAHFRAVTQLLLSHDESFLISASADSTVNVYNFADVFSELAPKPFHSWAGHALSVTSLAQLPGRALQQTVITASLDRSVRLWDVGTGSPVSTFTLPSGVNEVAAGHGAGEIFCACANGEIRSILTSCRASDTAAIHFKGHTGAVSGVAVNADGSRLVSCSDADKVRVWETRTRQCIAHVHASKSVQIGAVRVVSAAARQSMLPPFQPFQRLLTAPENLQPVPLVTGGRSAVLRQEMVRRADAQGFVHRIVWGQAAAAGGVEVFDSEQELRAKVEEVQADGRRWEAIAKQLFHTLVDIDKADGTSTSASSRPAAGGAGSEGGQGAPEAAPATAQPREENLYPPGSSPGTVGVAGGAEGLQAGVASVVSQAPSAAEALPPPKKRRRRPRSSGN